MIVSPSIAQQVNTEASAALVPLSVLIEYTYSCNLACYYCYQKEQGVVTELSGREWERILDELATLGTLYITFSGGEPFSRPDFVDTIAAARLRGFAVSIITNGSLLTPSQVRRLAGLSIMDIGISLHAHDAPLHDRLSGVAGSHAAACGALAFCREAGIKTIVKHTVSAENFGQFRELQTWAEAVGHLFECDSQVMPDHPGQPSAHALSDAQLREFLGFARAEAVTPVAGAGESWNLRCDAGRSVMGIRPNGDVVPCVMLPIVFGNASTGSVANAWQGEAASRFRVQESSVATECTSCTMHASCARCPGMAYAESGGSQWQGASPTLCRHGRALEGPARIVS